jgi:hypothetical protein
MRIENGHRVWRNEVEELHREDGPAKEWADGSNEWFIHGKPHREDGPAKEWAEGGNEWWIFGQLHREDGPAVEWINGDKAWYLHGLHHRRNGLARIEPGTRNNEYWVHNVRYSKKKFLNLLVQHHLKLQLLNQMIPVGAENFIDQYTL